MGKQCFHHSKCPICRDKSALKNPRVSDRIRSNILYGNAFWGTLFPRVRTYIPILRGSLNRTQSLSEGLDLRCDILQLNADCQFVLHSPQGLI